MFKEFDNKFPLVSKILSNRIKDNKLSHAYLFYGNDLNSIFDFSCIFSKVILCKSKTNQDNCNSCKLFEHNKNFIKPKLENENIKYYMNNHPDFIVWEKMDNKKFITIEQIRDLINENFRSPVLSDKKILFLNDISKLKVEGANALLKTLEEPNYFIIIILTVDSLDNVLNTILSRCQIFPLNNNYIENNIDLDLNKYLPDSYSKIYDLTIEINNLTKQEQINLLKNIQLNIWNKQKINNFLNLDNSKDILDKIDFYIKCFDNNVSSKNIIENFLIDLYRVKGKI